MTLWCDEIKHNFAYISAVTEDTRARCLSLARSKLRLCSANYRPGYWSNLTCDWPSTAWAYSEQETENRPINKVSYGVSTVSIWEKIDPVLAALHCIRKYWHHLLQIGIILSSHNTNKCQRHDMQTGFSWDITVGFFWLTKISPMM